MEKATYMQYDFFQGLWRNGQPKSIGLPIPGIPSYIVEEILFCTTFTTIIL